MEFVKPGDMVLQRARAYAEYRAYTDPFVSKLYWGKLREVFNYLRTRRWNTILEIGCGYGYLLPSLCQIGERVIGSDTGDVFEFCREVTLRLIQRKYGNLELRKIDARHLTSILAKETCDVIIAVSVLEHIPEYRATLEQIEQCLKRQGIFLCVLPTENLLYQIGRKILRYPDEYHRGYTYEKLYKYLAEYFQDVESWFYPFNIPLFHYGVYRRLEG